LSAEQRDGSGKNEEQAKAQVVSPGANFLSYRDHHHTGHNAEHETNQTDPQQTKPSRDRKGA
jgi:hypothetical protein